MLQRLCDTTIRRLKKLPPLVYFDKKNTWEEFSSLYKGNVADKHLWEDYILAQISICFYKLSEVDRLRAWLHTYQGRDWMVFKFDTTISTEYLNLKQIAQEVDYNADDVCYEVYNWVVASVTGYPFY